MASVLTPSEKPCISQFVVQSLSLEFKFSRILIYLPSCNMPYFFELWKWWEVVDIDNFASLVPLHVSTIYSSLHSAPEWHSFPIVTIEGYVWHKCGPDDDEVLHSTSFQAVIENFLKYKKKKKKKIQKINSSRTHICHAVWWPSSANW